MVVLKATLEPDRQARLAALRPRLVSFARLQLRDAWAADDAVQEALAAAGAGDARFLGKSGYETWVFGILKHKILDALRVQKRQGRWQPWEDELESLPLDALFQDNGRWYLHARPSSWGDPEAAFVSERFWQVFDSCLIALPDTVARVFSMRELMGMSTAEICREVHIKENHCWVILHRARLRLRACLEKAWLKED